MFGGGGGGLNPRKMQQMMEQMGIEMDELDANEVVIRTDDADLVFDDPDVTLMEARGQSTYQVVGDPEERAPEGAVELGDDLDEAADANEDGEPDEVSIPEADAAIVAERAGVDEDVARETLRAVDGDLAAAVDRLE
jgi:nascent polypeptide-associated complex subunit alpha